MLFSFRKSRVSQVSARILAMMSVSVSASWNASLSKRTRAVMSVMTALFGSNRKLHFLCYDVNEHATGS